MAIDENKQKALAAALGQIEKQFGKGSIMATVNRCVDRRRRTRYKPCGNNFYKTLDTV